MGNLNSKTYYFRFAVLFSYLQYFPLLKPKFFLLTLIFLKNSDFFKPQVFFNSDFFKKKLRCFQNSGFFFSELRFFRKKMRMSYTCWPRLLVQRKWTKWRWWSMVLSVFHFILCLSRGTSIMPPYIPVTSGNCHRNSSIECYFNLDWLTAAWSAKLGERRSAKRKVAGSNPGRTNTQDL